MKSDEFPKFDLFDAQIGAPDLPLTVPLGQYTITATVTEILRLNLVAALKRIEWLEERVARLEHVEQPALTRTIYLDGEAHSVSSSQLAMAVILALDGLDSHTHYLVALQDGKPIHSYRQWDEQVPLFNGAQFVSEYVGPMTNQ